MYLLKYKSQCVTFLQNFLLYVENQFHAHVKTIRSDNAKELCEGDVVQLFLAKGIHHQKSCTQTPQQNGVVECKHKHLLEVARALSFQSNSPITFWGEAVYCATHLINRMPLKSLGNLTPYEKLYNTKLDNSFLKA